jgi:hypothetical protein
MPASLQGPARLTPAPSTGALYEWQTVADFDFSLEPNQTISAGGLTFTDRISGLPVAFAAANGVAVVSGKLVLSSAAGSQLAVTNGSTDTAARIDAPLASLFAAYDGEALALGASLSAVTLAENAEAFGLMVNGPVRMGGGTLGHGYSVEVRHNGTNPVRSTRYQSGSTGVQALSTAAYASARALALRVDGFRPVACFGTAEADALTPEALAYTGPVGIYGSNSGGSPLGASGARLGLFAAGGATLGPDVSFTRLILRALKAV